MNDFAKLTGAGNRQIVAMRSYGEDGPQVAYYFQPAGLGVCTAEIMWPGIEFEKQENACNELWESLTDDSLREIRDTYCNQYEAMVGQGITIAEDS